jgi:uncharacterized protein (DUF488 family)
VRAGNVAPTAIWTFGHSTRTIDEFLELLREQRIEALADVRRFPGSRRLPHFGREALQEALSGAAIAYQWMPELGGRRRPRPDSRNRGWRNDSFRGSADYMETAEFAAALDTLIAAAASRRTAIMCAEALWWQCHRRLIADACVVRGHDVWHIRQPGAVEAHTLQPPAQIIGGELSYASDVRTGGDQRTLDL